MRPLKRRRALAGTMALVAAVALAGCADEAETSRAPGERLEVVASFYPIAEAAARVGGDGVRVTNLTPPGAEPHDVELTTRQVDRIEDADVVLYLGGGFQPAIAETAERRHAGRVDLLAEVEVDERAAEAPEPAPDHDDDGAGAAHDEDAAAGRKLDPHFWLNPVRMADAVDAIADAFGDVAPERADDFRANAAAYRAELLALDSEFERGLADCDRREIVTSHAAFSYLAGRYDLTQLAIAGLSPEAEPDADRIASLTDQIGAKGITTVFYEANVSPAVAETLAQEAGVTTAVLSPLEGLTRAQVEAGKDYVAVMRDNLAALRQALGCR